MAENAVYEPRRGLTFGDVWAALMELKEYHKETERLFRKSQEEAERNREMAALMINRDAKDLADELGMYVIEQSGDAVRLAERPEWFKAREW
jgi:hypothetical protein